MSHYGNQVAIVADKNASEETMTKKNTKQCGYCGISGHKVENCYMKKNDIAHQMCDEMKTLARQEFAEFKDAFSSGNFCVFCYGVHHYTSCDKLFSIPDDTIRTLMFCASSIAHGIVYSAVIRGYFANCDVLVTPPMFCDFSKAVSAVNTKNLSFTYRGMLIHYGKAYKHLLENPRIDDRNYSFVTRIKKCIENDVFKMFSCIVCYNTVKYLQY